MEGSSTSRRVAEVAGGGPPPMDLPAGTDRRAPGTFLHAGYLRCSSLVESLGRAIATLETYMDVWGTWANGCKSFGAERGH